MARRHGTAGRYAQGCTCDLCTDVNTQRAQRQRARRKLEQPKVHNASTYNNWGCKCRVCRDDHNRVDLLKRQAAGKGENSRKEWTTRELNYVLERKGERRWARTALECAKDLGRSVSAVHKIRSRGRVDMPLVLVAPLETIQATLSDG